MFSKNETNININSPKSMIFNHRSYGPFVIVTFICDKRNPTQAKPYALSNFD
jgi:hypothetical protein